MFLNNLLIPPLVLLVMTLPATASAFLLSSSREKHDVTVQATTNSRGNGSRINELLREKEEAARATTNPSGNGSRINKLLREKEQEFLSDISKLKKQHPQSTVEADNNVREAVLTTEQRVREALLSTRLELPFLHRSRIGPSTIDGAGRGLFATENIAKGEIITCYPGDALLRELAPSETDENDDLFENDEDFLDFDFDDDEEEAVDEVVLWGAHVKNKDRWDDDTVFDGSESTPPLTSYAIAVNDEYSIMGHPSLDDNPAYYGHFSNDGAGHLAFEKGNSQNNMESSLELGLATETDAIGVEECIAAYVRKSLEVANAIHKPPDAGELHMVTVVKRDIKEGEEILVTYGPDFWVGHA